jgi:hypothetical protein
MKYVIRVKHWEFALGLESKLEELQCLKLFCLLLSSLTICHSAH